MEIYNEVLHALLDPTPPRPHYISPTSPPHLQVLYDLLDPTGTRGTSKSKKETSIEIKEHPRPNAQT